MPEASPIWVSASTSSTSKLTGEEVRADCGNGGLIAMGSLGVVKDEPGVSNEAPRENMIDALLTLQTN